MGAKAKSNFIHRQYAGVRNFVLEQHFLPRWMVIVIDLSICLFSYIVTVGLLRLIPISTYNVLTVVERTAVLLTIQLICFALFRTYSGIIRHSTFTDVYRLALASGSVFLLTMIGNNAYLSYTGTKIFAGTGLLLYTFLSLGFLIAFRITVKESYRYMSKAASNNSKKRILVFGVNDQSIGLAQSLVSDANSPYRPVAFVSTNDTGHNYKIMNLPILNCCGKV